MELITKIKEILKENLDSPIIDLSCDSKGDIFGYVSSSTFENKDDTECQSIIWNSLRNKLSQKELIKIFMIYNETPSEMAIRLGSNTQRNNNPKYPDLRYKIWYHVTPTRSKYWLFIDATRVENDFKSIYLVLNAKENFMKGLIYNYPKNLIKFMQLKQENIYNELLDSAFTGGEAEIIAHLSIKYDEQIGQGIFGKFNNFNYIYQSFQLSPCSNNKLLFDDEEIKFINKHIKEFNGFDIQDDIKKAIKISTRINSKRMEIK